MSLIAGGLLSGKHRRNKAAPEGTRQVAGWKEPPVRDENALWDIVDELLAIARPSCLGGAGRAGMAARPARGDVADHRRPHRREFRDNLACVNVKLTDDERARLDKVSQPPLIYPYWHQSWTAKDRSDMPTSRCTRRF